MGSFPSLFSIPRHEHSISIYSINFWWISVPSIGVRNVRKMTRVVMEFADLDSKMIHVGHLVYPISDTIMQRKPSQSYESEARLPVNLEYQMTWSNSGQWFYAFVAGKPFPGKVTATCF